MQAIYDEVNAEGTAATPEPFVEPEGEPADAATTAAVTEVVVEVIRCNANGGNGLADAYYLTEEHFRQGLREMTPEDFASYTSKTPLEPEQWLMVYAVRNVRSGYRAPSLAFTTRLARATATTPEALLTPGLLSAGRCPHCGAERSAA